MRRCLLSAFLISLALPVLPAAAIEGDVDPPSVPSGATWTDRTGLFVESVSSSDDLRASWTAATDASSGMRDYRLQVSERETFDEIVADRYTNSEEPHATITSFDGITAGRSYYFRVLARDRAGNLGGWSGPSNRVSVRRNPDGPVIAHAPVTAAHTGRAVPIGLTTTCGSGCTVTLHYRATPVGDIAETYLDGGFAAVELSSGGATTLNGRTAVAFAGEIPGDVVTTTGVDYFLEAEDTFAIARFPGTTYAAVPAGGSVQGQGTYIHVHTLTPPLVTHVPPAHGRSDQPLPVSVQAVCSGACTATLYFRTTTGPIDETVAFDNGELLATPDWPRVGMQQQGPGRPAADAGTLFTYAAQIPAEYVDTRGVDYFVHVTDGLTQAWNPGTTYEGFYAPLDGMRTGYHHVRVLERPHIVHTPPAGAPYRDDIELTATSNCPATRECVATLWYRTTTSSLAAPDAFATAPMTVYKMSSADGNDAIELHGTIPAEVVDTRGVDYFFMVTDGATESWWPGVSASDGYAVSDGLRIAYEHVHVLEPPHIVHTPVASAHALRDLTVRTDVTCATEACAAELTYTDPDGSEVAVPMAIEEIRTGTAAGRIETWAATIPAEYVTTRGLRYAIAAHDGYTSVHAPGTSYTGAYVQLDGMRVAMFPVHVTEPPHPLHAPVLVARAGQPVALDVTSNCATDACTASLSLRIPGGPWRTVTMTRGTDTPDGRWAWHADIAGGEVTTDGLDYRILVDDGWVASATPTWSVSVAALL